MPEKNCDSPNGGKRKRGRRQKRGTDEAEEDREIKGVSNSRTVARDRKDCWKARSATDCSARDEERRFRKSAFIQHSLIVP